MENKIISLSFVLYPVHSFRILMIFFIKYFLEAFEYLRYAERDIIYWNLSHVFCYYILSSLKINHLL